MELDETRFAPVRRFGELILAAAVADIGAALVVWADAAPISVVPTLMLWVLLAVGLVHLVVAIGVLRRTPWGYPLLVWDLRLLSLGVPFGLRFPRAMLRYLRKNRIDRFFRRPAGSGPAGPSAPPPFQ
jgi:hypothetical protein